VDLRVDAPTVVPRPEPREARPAGPTTDPFAALDVEIATAIAAKLAEALRRYATPAIIPLVLEKMVEDLDPED